MNLSATVTQQPLDILLVEDDEGDVLLTKKALGSAELAKSMRVAKDGVEAMAILRKDGEYADSTRPDLILLDLNMPRMDGRETLAQIKQDEQLRTIPVVVFTTSDSDRDVLTSYELQASCFITKPADLEEFTRVVQALKDFWLSVVQLPPR